METIRELFKKYREQITYIFFGGLTTLVNWVVYAILAYLVFGEGDFNKSIAKAIAIVASIVFAFFTNKFFVFQKSDTENLLRELLTFAGARAASFFLELGAFSLFVDVIGINDVIVNLGVAVFVVILNYVLSKFLVFKK